MIVYIGSDHHGEKLRPRLASYVGELGYEYEDLGLNVDFPLMAQAVAARILEEGGMGILICGTGHGMAIAASRFPGIRAAVCRTIEDAQQAREHLDANVLAIGADCTKYDLAIDITRTFLSTQFSGKDRYLRRIEQIG
jgi:ribose 5-phosphate isomerase B